MQTNSPGLTKAEARRHARELMLGCPAAVREQVLRHLAQFLDKRPFDKILAYNPLKDELDPWPVLRQTGLPVYVPFLLTPTDMEFRLCHVPYAEPGNEVLAEITESSLAIVPLLSSNALGFRLGRGRGFYDRWKERLSAAVKVGLLPNALCSVNFREENHDLRLDSIISEVGIVEFKI